MIKTGYDRATSLFVEYYKFCLVDKGSYKMVIDFSVIISTTFTQEIKPPCLAFLQYKAISFLALGGTEN